MREEMENMTTLEIIGDFLHIAWYIAWRSAVILTAFIGFMYLLNWEWWR